MQATVCNNNLQCLVVGDHQAAAAQMNGIAFRGASVASINLN